MREVRMKTQYAGPAGQVAPGKVGKFSDKEAESLVNGGYGQYEKAVVEIPEKRAEEPEKSLDFSKMNKKSLLAHAQQSGIAVPKGATNKQIRALLDDG